VLSERSEARISLWLSLVMPASDHSGAGTAVLGGPDRVTVAALCGGSCSLVGYGEVVVLRSSNGVKSPHFCAVREVGGCFDG
jgi:hypothetical protein